MLLITKKFLFWNFWGWKIWYSLSQKISGKIFTGYWKVLVLNFSMMGNMVFFWVHKLMEKMIFPDYGKVLVLNFSGWEIRYFLSQEVDGKMIFTGYGKVLVLNFSGMGNTGFFWAKKLMERWYLLVTEKFLFWTFRWGETRSFLSQEVDRKMIFTGYGKVLVLNFSVIGNTVFFESKSWWKDDI